MQWKSETEEQKIERLSNWHECFAVMPAQTKDGKTVWMGRVMRHMDITSNWAGTVCHTEYLSLDAYYADQASDDAAKQKPERKGEP